MNDGVAELDILIRTRHLLKHPFYEAWSNGTLPLDTLREYAGQYYHFESRFPQFVASTYALLDRASDRRILLDNLIDEEGRDPTHPELWLDFAEGIGLDRASASRSAASDETRALCETYFHLTREKAAVGLAALYAYESIFPEVAREKSRGLRENYQITKDEAHEFFRVHGFADVAHSAAEARILSTALSEDPSARSDAVRGAADAVEAWWKFLDQFGM